MLLSEDSARQNALGIYLHPGLSINNMSYRGYLESSDIFDAICASFTALPPVCKDPFATFIGEVQSELEVMKMVQFENEEARKDLREGRVKNPRHVRKVIAISIISFLVVAQIVAFLFYRMRR